MRILAPVLVLSLLWAGGSIPAQPTPDPVAEVSIHGSSFNPRDLTIAVGETVQWTNNDRIGHTVTFGNEFGSGPLGPGATYSHTFWSPGVFGYFCGVHANGGAVEVVVPPDLVIGALIAAQTIPGFEAQVDITVLNIGPGDARPTRLEVVYVYQGAEHRIGTAEFGPIPSSGAAMVPMAWDTFGKLGDFVLVARADPQRTMYELDYANNVQESTASLLLPPGILDGIDLHDPL